jgi:WD40 repeat protein/DNA-binding SARP family transcriptional activator
MGIQVLGPLSIDGATRDLSRRDRVVMAALAANRGEPVSADALADALWGDEPPPSAAKVVQGCVSRLRKILGPQTIETVPNGYRLSLAPDELDSQRFDRLVDRARDLLALGEPERAGFVLDEGLALWRGPALSELTDWGSGRAEAERLENERLDAEELRLDAALRAGNHETVVAHAERLVWKNPLRERRWALLALAQYRCGRQADALSTLRRVRAILRHELALDPGPELARLEAAILAQDEALLGPQEPPEASATCPYLGLVPYGVDDADGFFGRGVEIAACLRRLESGFVAIVGPSGSGKSSLLRAGVVAALVRDGRRVVVITPGPHPMRALDAVPERGATPVLAVDQCEEVFTVCDDPRERAEFLDALVRHAAIAPLAVCVRGDRLGDLAVHSSMAHLVESGLYLVPGMDDVALRAAIEGPARQSGLRLEPGLVDLLVREVEGAPGGLPMLSHALQAAWEHREGRVLTVAGYQSTGGIRGAVAQSAERVYDELSPEERVMLRHLLLRLVASGEEGEVVRTRVPRRQVSGDADHEQLIETLVRARLVTSGDGVVELAHEALVREWPRLRTWLDDDNEGFRILRHLATVADTWDAMGRPASELYRGGRLAQALEWRDRTHPDLTAVEAAFLRAAEQRALDEEASATLRVRRERRVNRRLKATLAGVVLLALALVTAGLAAVRQSDRAELLADRAVAGRVSAQALLTEEPDKALLLAVAAIQLDNTSENRANLLELLSRQPQLVGATQAPGGGLWRGDVSPDGRILAVYDDRNTVYLYDTQTMEVEGAYDTNRPGVEEDNLALSLPLAFSPDGGTLAVGTENLHPLPVHLVDTETYERKAEQLGGFPEGRVAVWDIVYSADGGTLAAGLDVFRGSSSQAYVVVWAADNPSVPVRTIGPGDITNGLALSPNGRTVYVAARGQGAGAVSAYLTRGHGRPIELSVGRIDGMQLSGDGTLFATSDRSGIRLSDARTGHVVRHLDSPSPPRSTRFSSDAHQIAAFGADRVVRVWEVSSGRLLEQFEVGADALGGLDFSPDGSLLYTAATDRDIRVWDLSGVHRFLPRAEATNPPDWGVYDWAVVIPAPDGSHVLSAWMAAERAWFDVLDRATGKVTAAVDAGHGAYGFAAWHPSGDRFATTGKDGAVRVWDARTGALLGERQVSDVHLSGIAFVGPGETIAVSNRVGEVYALDAETLRRVGPVLSVADLRITNIFAAREAPSVLALTGVRSPGGPSLAVQPDRGWAMFDLETGEVREGTLPLHSAAGAALSPDAAVAAVSGGSGELAFVGTVTREATLTSVRPQARGQAPAFAPDGDTVVSGGSDGSVNLWDVASGESLGSVTAAAGTSAAAQWLPDGRTVLIATYDGQAFTWDTDPDSWVDAACRIARRDLTDAEWADAFGDRPYVAPCAS